MTSNPPCWADVAAELRRSGATVLRWHGRLSATVRRPLWAVVKYGIDCGEWASMIDDADPALWAAWVDPEFIADWVRAAGRVAPVGLRTLARVVGCFPGPPREWVQVCRGGDWTTRTLTPVRVTALSDDGSPEFEAVARWF